MSVTQTTCHTPQLACNDWRSIQICRAPAVFRCPCICVQQCLTRYHMNHNRESLPNFKQYKGQAKERVLQGSCLVIDDAPGVGDQVVVVPGKGMVATPGLQSCSTPLGLPAAPAAPAPAECHMLPASPEPHPENALWVDVSMGFSDGNSIPRGYLL